MSIAVLAAQVTTGRDAGFWPPSLFAYEEHPFPESSATGFFVSGLLFGVRTGRLNASEYLPAAERGWAALLSAQLPDGRIGWTQQIGAGPDDVKREATQLYSTGAFLKAAAELLKFSCASGAAPQLPACACVASALACVLRATLLGARFYARLPCFGTSHLGSARVVRRPKSYSKREHGGDDAAVHSMRAQHGHATV